MLRVTKGQVNELIVTVTELTTLSNPNYLFSFHDVQGNSDYNVVLVNTSSYTERYDSFNLDEPNDVNFLYTGDYTYTIYEQVSAVNTDPANATGIVEQGRMKVLAASENVTRNYYEDGTTENNEYDDL